MTEKFIRTMRLTKGLKQDELAKLCNVSTSTISGYETGYREPNFEMLNKISSICGFELEFINKEKNIKLNTKNIERKEI